MMKNYLLLLLTLLSFTVTARESILKDAEANRKIEGTRLLRYTDKSTVPDYIQFQTSSAPTIEQLKSWMQKNLNMGQNYDWLELNRSKDQIGMEHIRYRQTYKGVAIQGTMYIVHCRNGKVESVNGLLYNDLPNLNIQANLSVASSLQIALNKVNANLYKWQVPAEEKNIKAELQDANATYYPKAEKLILKQNGVYHLCYAFNIYAHEPMGRTMEYVDATTGKIILSKDLIEHVMVNGTAVTKYSGTKPFQTDSTAPTSFRLRDSGRGLGVNTYNMSNGSNYGTAVDFTDLDNYWNNVNAAHDEAATDAQWGAQKTYDYFYNSYGRNSIDDAGFSLKSYIHYNTNYANAFWDGTRMTYGDGSFSQGFLTMTALDVCGHEIAHGLTNFTADLSATSSGTQECDALNEAYSDVFGTAIEKYARPTQWDWVIGGDITCNSSGVPNGVGIRLMSNPASLGQPNCYLGPNWNTSGEPHDNDGPLIYWYYLLSTGSLANNITALGTDTAANIAFRTLTVHLFPSADYADARFYSIVSSTELYGGCSTPTIATTNAWSTVCVGSPYVAGPTTSNFIADNLQSCNTSLTVNFTNTSTNGNTFNWDFGDGTYSTAFNPTHTYSSGIYTVKLMVDGGTCGLDTLVRNAYIQVGPPSAPLTTGATLCAPGSAIITATPNNTADSIRWYTTATGGTSVYTGNSYTTPFLPASTTYYAEEVVTSPSYHVGPLNNTIGAGSNYTNTTRFMIFNCTSPTILKSVWVMASSAGNRTIILKNSAGTTLQTVVVNIPNGASVVNLNMPIPVGTDMQIGLATGSAVNLYRNSTGAVYPYTNGPISITGNNAAGSATYYYFFYDWILQNADCVSARTQTNVIVGTSGGITPASITPSGNINVCAPNSIALTANTGVSLSYQWYNGTTAISGATNGTYSATTSGNYSVVVSSSSGCLAPGTSATTSIAIVATPVAAITPSSATTFCQGGSVVLTATSGTGYSYQWYLNGTPITGATTSNYTATTGGNYTVLITNSSNCSSTSTSMTVVVNPSLTASISPTNTASFCNGSSLLFSASTGVGYTYQWYLNGTPISGANASTYNATQAGNYYVVITNSSNCSATSTTTAVSIVNLSFATITPLSATTFCQGSSVVLNATSGSNYSYQWYLNGTPISGATLSYYSAYQSGNYTVLITNGSGCTSTSTATNVIVNPLPAPVITNTGTLLSVTGGPFSSYQWYLNGAIISGAIGANYNATQNGLYSVIVYNINDCYAQSQTIHVKTVGINDIIDNSSITISPNPTTDLVRIEGIHPNKIKILNMQGQIIKVVLQKNEISLSEIANGIYIMELFNEDGILILNKKIIKQ